MADPNLAGAVPDELPWYAAFPAPKSSSAITLPREKLLAWLREGKVPGKDFVLVDLRRNDYKGGTIRGSLNLPAQSLFPTIPYLFNLVSAAGIKKTIWYCGSSTGRGSRGARWFQDYIKEQGREGDMESVALEGGIKGWVAAGEEYIKLVDGFEASVWIKE